MERGHDSPRRLKEASKKTAMIPVGSSRAQISYYMYYGHAFKHVHVYPCLFAHEHINVAMHIPESVCLPLRRFAQFSQLRKRSAPKKKHD